MSEVSAYHESGHALVAIFFGAGIRMITIEPDWDDGPPRHAEIQIQWPAGLLSDRALQERSADVALAGPVAEMIYRGEPYHPGMVAEWATDWQAAWAALEQIIPDQRARLAYLEQATVRLYRQLSRDDCWAALAAIADNLLAHETLEGEEVESIVKHWLP